MEDHKTNTYIFKTYDNDNSNNDADDNDNDNDSDDANNDICI